MSKPVTDPIKELAPVQADAKQNEYLWTERLVLFLRVVAGISMFKGLFHWALVCGISVDSDFVFDSPLHSVHWRTATVFFAIIDLVAAVGLWLAAPWGVVVWLTASVSMVAVAMFFPQVYGQQFAIVVAEIMMISGYLFLAVKSAGEQPQ
jgi:Family of unknown function (DUF6163)